jgi:hypothetical protein
MSGVSDIYRNRGALGSPQQLDKHRWSMSFIASADTFILEAAATTNYGTADYIGVTPYNTWRRVGLLRFNLPTALPTPYIARLRMKTIATGAADRIIAAYRLLRTDWVETEATWYIYKTGSSWGWSGALNDTTDFTTVAAAYAGAPGAYLWAEWDVTRQVETALASVSGVVHILLRDTGASAAIDNFFNTREDGGDVVRPRLVISSD